MSAPAIAFEKHYRVQELAKLWCFCENTVIKLFDNEPGVIRLERFAGKRKYTTLSIPESVALRVHERFGNQSLKAALPAVNPLRIIRLRDFNAGVPKQARNIAKLKPRQQLANCERVA